MKVPSRFYSSLGLLLLLNALVKPLWIFWIDRTVQNQNGTAGYGTYFSLCSFSMVLLFISDMGLTAFMNRQLAAREAGTPDHSGHYFRLKLLLLFLYSSITLLAAWLTGIRQWEWLLLLTAIQVLNSFFLFTRALITARQWFRADAWFSVLDKSLMLLACGGFLLLPSTGYLSIELFLWFQLASTGLAVLLSLVYLYSRGQAFHYSPSPAFYKDIIRASWPFGLIVLIMTAHNRLDAFLLERLHPDGAVEAGIYAGAYRLLDAGNMAGYLIASFLLPYIAKHQSSVQLVKEAVLFSRHILLLFATGVSVLTVTMAPALQSILYHNQDSYAMDVLRYCVPALIAYSVIQVYGTVLTATGHILLFCRIMAISLLLNTVLNLVFIPAYGALACCFTALTSQSFAALLVFIQASRKTGISRHGRSFLYYLITGIILFCFLYFGGLYTRNYWLLAVTGCLLVLLLALLFKLIKPGWLIRILQKN